MRFMAVPRSRASYCDQQRIMHTDSWQQGSGKGLLNTGNTCYANAGLQLLMHLPILARACIEVPRLLEETRVTLELIQLMEDYWDSEW